MVSCTTATYMVTTLTIITTKHTLYHHYYYYDKLPNVCWFNSPWAGWRVWKEGGGRDSRGPRSVWGGKSEMSIISMLAGWLAGQTIITSEISKYYGNTWQAGHN